MDPSAVKDRGWLKDPIEGVIGRLTASETAVFDFVSKVLSQKCPCNTGVFWRKLRTLLDFGDAEWGAYN
jgi:hypothetical protein